MPVPGDLPVPLCEAPDVMGKHIVSSKHSFAHLAKMCTVLVPRWE